MSANERVGVGGGCHWCTEAVFELLPGVSRVAQGYIRSLAPDEEFAEAVLLRYDRQRLSLQRLLEVHLHSHACSAPQARAGKYRSAIYVFDAEQAARVREGLAALRWQCESPPLTRVLLFAGFRRSPLARRHYYARDPGRPFCCRYIRPKLERLLLSAGR